MNPTDLPAWAQGGGLVLFALAVWYELRQQRTERREDAAAHGKILDGVRETVSELGKTVELLLERLRLGDPDLTPPLGNPRIEPPPPRTELGYRRPATPGRGTDVVRMPLRKPTRDDSE